MKKFAKALMLVCGVTATAVIQAGPAQAGTGFNSTTAPIVMVPSHTPDLAVARCQQHCTQAGWQYGFRTRGQRNESR